ncbi:MAG: hypothetical protein MHMPM18_003088, partial [Marteilia pararefringens]
MFSSQLCQLDSLESVITEFKDHYDRENFLKLFCEVEVDSDETGGKEIDDESLNQLQSDLMDDPYTKIMVVYEYLKQYGSYAANAIWIIILLYILIQCVRQKKADHEIYYEMSGRMKRDEYIKLLVKNKVLNQFLRQKLIERENSITDIPEEAKNIPK